MLMFLVCVGACLAADVRVSLRCKAISCAYPADGTVRLVDATGETHRPTYDQSRAAFFSDVAEGDAEIIVDDERFAPLMRTLAVEGDQQITLILDGASMVSVDVVALGSGAVSPTRCSYEFAVAPGEFSPGKAPFYDSRRRASDVPLAYQYSYRVKPAQVPATPGAEGPVGALLRVPSSTYRLRVELPNYAPAFVSLPALKPGETRKVQVVLQEGGAVSGVVRGSNGEVLAAEVAVFANGEAEREPFGIEFVRPRTPFERYRYAGEGWWRAIGTSDNHGRFEISGLEPGQYVARVRSGIANSHQGFSAPFVIRNGGHALIELEASGHPIEDPFKGR